MMDTANAVVLVYDITNRQSYNDVSKWFTEIENKTSKKSNLIKILVGTKKDMEDKR